MLADSPRNRLIVRTVVILFRLYGPLCLSYTLWSALVNTWPELPFGHDWLASSPLLLSICIPEALFYIFSLWHAQRIQAAAEHPPLRTKDERLRLFEKVRAEVDDFEDFLLGWFLRVGHEEIGVKAVREWIDWALWEGRAGELKEEGTDAEIDEYVQRIEKLLGRPFQDGPGMAKALRLTLDPIAVEPRSLAWYGLIMIADTSAILTLKSRGFVYYRRPPPSLAAVFPPRPATWYDCRVSPVPSLSYFLRDHTSKTRLPVIYLHGIGIGLLPHIAFLEEMRSALNAGSNIDDQVGILAIETLQISSRLTTSIPRSAEFVSQLTTIVDYHFGPGRFVLVAHSYGTVLSTAILRDFCLSSRISGTLFIDPISILLHMPEVAYNFTRRKPVRASEWALWWFGKDPQLASTLGRHLFCSECVLWRDQIEYLIKNHGMRLTASLSSNDLIVNTRSVRDYLIKAKLQSPVGFESIASREREKPGMTANGRAKAQQWRGVGLEVLWWNGYDHAEVLDTQEDRSKLVRVVVEYCNSE